MAEEIANIMQRFALSSKDLSGLNLEDEDVDKGIKECQTSLIGEVVREKIVNYVGVKHIVSISQGVMIREVRTQCFSVLYAFKRRQR